MQPRKQPRIRRRVLTAAVAAITVLGLTACSGGSDGNSSIKSLKLIAGAAPASGWDQTARGLQAALEKEKIVSSVEVTNTAGASGTVALAQFAGASGNELLMTGLAMTSGVIINNTAVTLNDTTPIARLMAEYEAVVVPADSKFKTITDLTNAIKADPKGVPIAGGSAGSADHILLGLLAQKIGVKAGDINFVPFSGGGEVVTQLLGNKVAAGVSGTAEFAEQVKSGKLRILAVSSSERLPGSDAKTFVEQGLDITLANWRGVVAPKNASAKQRDAFIDAITEVAKSDTWKKTLTERNWDDQLLTGKAFEKFIADDNKRLESVLADLGLS